MLSLTLYLVQPTGQREVAMAALMPISAIESAPGWHARTKTGFGGDGRRF
jgi:hypothetical protein